MRIDLAEVTTKLNIEPRGETVLFETVTVSGSAASNPFANATATTNKIVYSTSGTIRLRTDGVDPTASIGLSVPAGLYEEYANKDALDLYRAIGESGAVTINVEYRR